MSFALLPNVQYSANGDVHMDVVGLTAQITRQDGIQAHFSNDLQHVDGNTWTMITCPLESRDALPPQALNGLSNVPLFSEAGNPNTPDFIDMSGGCISFQFSGSAGDRFRIGQASTVVQVNETTADWTITPENSFCSYLHCESLIVVDNTGTESINVTTDTLLIGLEGGYGYGLVAENVQIPYLRNTVVCDDDATSCNVTSTDTVYRQGDLPLAQGDSVLVEGGSVGTFRLVTDVGSPQSTFKYNVSLDAFGQTYLIDPFFFSDSSNFSNGNFNLTFLNTSGFVQLNSSQGFGNGDYLSEVFDSGSNATWQNISWVGTPNGTYLQLPEQRAQTGWINMSENLMYHAFGNESALAENLTHVKDLSGFGMFVSCDDGASQCASVQTGTLFGKVRQFDGLNDHFDHPDTVRFDLSQNQSITVMAWINTTDASPDMHIFGQRDTGNGDGWMLHIESTGLLELYWDAGPTVTMDGVTVVNDGSWHHVAAVLDKSLGEMRIYVNGQRDGTPTAITGNPDSTDAFTLGAHPSSGSAWEGQMDEFAWFNETLTDEEIFEIARRGHNTLNMSYRACNDAACSGESFGESLSDQFRVVNETGRYFQYRVDFVSTQLNISPYLNNVTVNFDLLAVPDIVGPNVTGLTAVPNPVQQLFIVNLSATITDPSGIENSVVAEVNGTNYSATDLGNDVYSVLLNTSVLGVQEHNFTFWANDTSGFLGNATSTFNVSAIPVGNPAPVGSFVSAVPDPVTTNEFVNITVNWTDDGTVDTVLIELNNTNFSAVSSGGDLFSLYINTTNLSIGTVNFTSYANDTEGNSSQVSASFVVQEDQGGLVIGQCTESVGGVLLLWLIVIISFALVVMGMTSGVGVFGFLGSLMILVSSWFLVGCAPLFGYMFALFGTFLCAWFVLGTMGRRTGFFG